MPALKNQRHEAFARLMVEGIPYTRAYELAGYAANDGNACRLNRNESVAGRVAELQQALIGKLNISMETIAKMLLEDRALAHRTNAPGAAATASMGIAKLLGHITDRSEQTINHNYAQMTEEEVLFEIASIHQELRQIKASKGKVSH